MNNTARIAFAVFMAAAPAAAQVSDSLTVGAALEMVLANNPSLQETARSIEASRARVELSRGAYYPTAGIDASYFYMTPIPEIDFLGLSFKVAPNNNYDAHIGAQQMIYDFNRTGSQVSLASSRVALAEDNHETLKRDLAFRAAGLFYTILFAHQAIRVQDDQIRTLNEHLDVARKKIDAGTALQLDSLTTQVRVANATTVKINLETSLRAQEIAFRKLAGLPPDAPVRLKGEIAPVPQPLRLDSLLAIALENRVEEKGARDAVASAKAQVDAARLTDAPSLNAIAAYGFKNGYIPNLDVLRGNILGGVQLSIPLLDGKRSRSMEQEATALLRGVEFRKIEVDQTVQADVEQAIAEAKAAEQRVETSKVAIEQADLAVRTARLRYEAGTVPNLDLLDALSNQTQAHLTNLRALYDQVISSLSLRRSIGAPTL